MILPSTVRGATTAAEGAPSLITKGLAGGTAEAARASTVVQQEARQYGLTSVMYGQTGATSMVNKVAQATPVAAAPVAEETAGAGIMAGVGGAVMPAMMGMMAGGVVQQATGLRGGAIGTAGGGVAGAVAGGALGSIVPGVGTAIGAGVGAALGSALGPTIAHLFGGGSNYGKKIADGITKGMPEEVQQQFTKSISGALNKANSEMARAQVTTMTGVKVTVDQKALQAAQQQYNKAGTQSAEAFMTAYNAVQYKSTSSADGRIQSDASETSANREGLGGNNDACLLGEFAAAGEAAANRGQEHDHEPRGGDPRVRNLPSAGGVDVR